MSITKCISCKYAIIRKDYNLFTKVVIGCIKHQNIFAPECKYGRKEKEGRR